jgi:hypothetical protein
LKLLEALLKNQSIAAPFYNILRIAENNFPPISLSPFFFFFELKRIIGPAAAAGHSQLESLNR